MLENFNVTSFAFFNSRDKKKAVRKPLFLIVLTLSYLTMAFSSPLAYLMAIASSEIGFIFEAWPAEPKAS